MIQLKQDALIRLRNEYQLKVDEAYALAERYVCIAELDPKRLSEEKHEHCSALLKRCDEWLKIIEDINLKIGASA